MAGRSPRLILVFAVTTLSKHAMFHSFWRGLDHQDECSSQTLFMTIIVFNLPPKHRRLSEARLARVEHKAVVNELLGEKEPDNTEAEFLEPVTT